MRRLLVHRTQGEAERAIRLLGIEAEPCGMHDSMMATQFDQIIVLGIDLHHLAASMDFINRLRCRLSRNGELGLLF